MKKHDSQMPYNLVDQARQVLPKHFFVSVLGSNDVKTAKDNSQNAKNNNQTTIQTNSSFCSNAIESENKQPNDLGITSLAVTHCLNNQCKITDAVWEICQYLKILSEDGAVASNQSAQKQKQIVTSSSTATVIAANRSMVKQGDGISKKSFLQSIMNKIEGLQKEIGAKMKDFDGCFRSTDSKNSVNLTSGVSPLDDFSFSANKRMPAKPRMSSQLAEKKILGNMIKKKAIPKLSSSQERLKNMPFDLYQRRRETLPDETLNFSKNNFEVPSTENSRVVNLNQTMLGSETTKYSKNTDKKLFLTQKKVSSKLQLNPHDTKSTKDASNTTPVSNLDTISRGKFENTLAVKLDLQPNTKNLHETLSKYMSYKKVSKEQQQTSKNDKKNFSRVQLRSKKAIHDRESSSLDRESKFNSTRVMISARRGTTANINTTSGAEFMSLKSSPRDVNFDFGMRKNSTKPNLDIIPQKEIFDDGIPDLTADNTTQKDNSIVSAGELTPNANDLGGSLNLDTERVYGMFEMDDFMPDPTYSFVKSTARKEKMILKTLMKDQYGEDVSSFQKANHGQVYQKKCLVNARWWRTWKDFVNFDSEESGANKMFEIGLYPRPGSINNRELIRQEVLLDLGNLTPELELKENLLEHHDYEAVSKKIFDVLAKWYGFDFEICRVLRPDPFGENKPYLELYPKKKMTMKTNQASLDTRNSNNSTVINSIINSNLGHNPV